MISRGTRLKRIRKKKCKGGSGREYLKKAENSSRILLPGRAVKAKKRKTGTIRNRGGGIAFDEVIKPQVHLLREEKKSAKKGC